MEAQRYGYCTQNNPGFLGSGASESVPSNEGSNDDENIDHAEFDANLEKGRNVRKKKKQSSTPSSIVLLM